MAPADRITGFMVHSIYHGSIEKPVVTGICSNQIKSASALTILNHGKKYESDALKFKQNV